MAAFFEAAAKLGQCQHGCHHSLRQNGETATGGVAAQVGSMHPSARRQRQSDSGTRHKKLHPQWSVHLHFS